MEIIPAIIPKSFSELKEKMSSVRDLVPLVQVDVMDGKLTPEASWPYLSAGQDQDFANIISEKSGFPFWQELDFEVDLMVRHPENVWRDWLRAGASRIIIHIESTFVLESIIKEFKTEFFGKDSFIYSQIGLAINIETPVQKILPFVQDIDFVQCMGIAKIGFQGQPFDERVLLKIRELKSVYPDLIISVDGGVSLETVSRLIKAGVSRLVAGSAIFASGDIIQTIKQFNSI